MLKSTVGMGNSGYQVCYLAMLWEGGVSWGGGFVSLWTLGILSSSIQRRRTWLSQAADVQSPKKPSASELQKPGSGSGPETSSKHPNPTCFK